MAEAIESILAQDYRPLEIIAVDDGSTDDSAAVIQRFGPPVRYFYQANAGISAARNTGIRHAKATLLSFLDSDDIWLPGKLTNQYAALRESPQTEIVYAHAEQFFSPEVDADFRRKVRLDLQPMPAYLVSAMLIWREAFERIGWFDESVALGTEMDWFARMKDIGPEYIMMSDVVLRRRIHYSNANIDVQASLTQRLHTLKTIIDRRREQNNTTPRKRS